MTPDTEHKDAPVCPHCGEVYEDGEYFFGEDLHDNETRNTHCRNNCGGEFIVTRHVTVTYSTRKM